MIAAPPLVVEVLEVKGLGTDLDMLEEMSVKVLEVRKCVSHVIHLCLSVVVHRFDRHIEFRDAKRHVARVEDDVARVLDAIVLDVELQRSGGELASGVPGADVEREDLANQTSAAAPISQRGSRRRLTLILPRRVVD